MPACNSVLIYYGKAMTDDTDMDDTDHSGAEEGVGEVSSEETSKPYGRGERRLTDAQLDEICEIFAAGKMKSSRIAEMYGVSVSNISQLLKRRRVIWASKVTDDVKSEVDKALHEKPPAADPTFAEKRKARIEQTREESYNAIRMIRIKALRAQAEAERLGAPIASLKETIRVYRFQLAIQMDASKALLWVLEADKHVDEADLPQIFIRDLGEEDLKALREMDDDDSDIIDEDDLEDSDD